MKKLVFACLFFSCVKIANAQRSVAITIDDVPNTQLYQAQNFRSVLLNKLDSLKVSVAIFINENNLTQTRESEKNKSLLQNWLAKDYVTAGNHGFAHKNYVDVGLEAFKEDVVHGEVITKKLLKGLDKELKYFRFPYNGLGKDSLDQMQALHFLKEKHYISTPFTVESADWLHAILYDKALREKDQKTARWVGEQYVDFTLRLFSYFDSLSVKLYDRSISQIYLCHDNTLNRDYLPAIVDKLKKKDYQFVGLDDAMRDPAYQQPYQYYGKEGFSWMYRWMKDTDERNRLMRAEPGNPEIRKAFEEMSKTK